MHAIEAAREAVRRRATGVAERAVL